MQELTERQRRLLWEILTIIDVDTLNDNLERVRQPRVAIGESELTELMDIFDPDNKFILEWVNL